MKYNYIIHRRWRIQISSGTQCSSLSCTHDILNISSSCNTYINNKFDYKLKHKLSTWPSLHNAMKNTTFIMSPDLV